MDTKHDVLGAQWERSCLPCLSVTQADGAAAGWSHIEVTASGSLREKSCDKFTVRPVRRGTQGHCEPLRAAVHLSGGVGGTIGHSD